MHRDVAQRSPLVIAVSGEAGSGKSTLGRALAERLRLPLLDLDSITNPVLDSIPEARLGGHWLASDDRSLIRAGRYAALRAVLRDVLPGTNGAVLVAPFTRELAGGTDHQQLVEAAGAGLTMVHLTADPDVIEQRRRSRGEGRDSYRPRIPTVAPSIPVVSVAAELTTADQLRQVLQSLGCSDGD